MSKIQLEARPSNSDNAGLEVPLNASRLSIVQQEDIAEARRHKSYTLRPTVPALEALMFEVVPVLDHGFVRVIDYMGNDAAIVQAARVSYGRGTTIRSDDRTLLRYLLRHRHTTPMEMCELKIHAKMPIFIARQWIRTRTASVNEQSGRYSILDREFYLPDPGALAPQSKTNRQGRDVQCLDDTQAAQVLELLRDDATRNYAHYQELLNEDDQGQVIDPQRDGLARELARMNLTLNYYTQWYWKIDLHNLLHFLGLRMDSHAQYEMRLYANAIGDVVKAWVPDAWEAFIDYRFEAKTFSRMELDALRAMLAGQTPDLKALGLTSREIGEFEAKIKGG